jgi:hypothetical protein
MTVTADTLLNLTYATVKKNWGLSAAYAHEPKAPS